MNEILKKRIEEAACDYCDKKQYIEIVLNKNAFITSAEYILSHQWINVEEALPEYGEPVIVAYGDEEYGLCHRSGNPDVLTDKNGFCNYGYKEVLGWMPIPEFETKEKDEKR